MQMKKLWIGWLGVALMAGSSIAAEEKKAAPAGAGTAVAEKKENSAIVPSPREGKWMDRHNAINERIKKGNVDLLFIGDSITQGWEGAGKDVWAKYYNKRNAANLGIGGDRTQHVLWRLENGNIAGIRPKAAVIMIGTNNSNREDNSVAEIAAGITAIVTKLRTELPEMKILLVSIFPRGAQPNDQRGKILQVNQIINKLADNEHVWFADFGYKFVEKDGSISKEIMPDYLHLSPAGYEVWAQAIEPKLVKLLGEK